MVVHAKAVVYCAVFLMVNIFPIQADSQFLDLLQGESKTSETEAGDYPDVPSTFNAFNADHWDIDHITEITKEK